jgi:mRNA interferase HigB
MILVGQDKIDAFVKRNAQAREPMQAWVAEVKHAQWKTPQHIKNRYRSADFLKNNRVIFNVKGNSYRLVAKVAYQTAVVFVEWMGRTRNTTRRSFETNEGQANQDEGRPRRGD